MLTLLIPALALAATPAEAVDAAFAAWPDGPPDVVVACAPLGGVADVAATMPMLPALAGLLAQVRGTDLQAFLTREDSAAAGLATDGALAVATWPQLATSVVTLPFAGDAVQAEALLGSLGFAATATGEGAWQVSGGRGVRGEARMEAGELTVETGPAAGVERALPSPPLHAGMGTGPGCLVSATPAEPMGDNGDLRGLAIELPFDPTKGLRLRVDTTSPPPASLSGGGAVPLGGTTAERPVLVATLGASLNDVVLEPAWQRVPGMPPELAALADARVRVLPGLTAAIFARSDDVGLVVVVPLAMDNGRPVPPRALVRRLAKLGKKGDLPLEKTGPTSFVVVWDDQILFGEATEGRLVLGSRANRVSDVIVGAGTPWLDAEATAAAATWPLMLTGDPPGMPVGELAIPFLLGMRTVDGRWEVEVQPTLVAVAALLQMGMSM